MSPELVLVRAFGTEPVIRVMVEEESKKNIKQMLMGLGI